jgi:protein-S-isoprenylcysteine O-methyltransferase Ste14
MKDKPVLPPTYLLLAIVMMLALHFLFPVATAIKTPWHIVGTIPLAIGLILNILADREFKKHQTTVKPFEESTTLITTGVYRISRNPMYLGFVLILSGVALFLGSLIPVAVVLFFPGLMEVVFIRSEEAMLEQQFGETWLAYKQQVRRWI